MLVGIAGTLVISYAGEAAESEVSLVNQFNTIFIYIFTALAFGGAVVVSPDWLFKATLFEIRFRKGVWKQCRVI